MPSSSLGLYESFANFSPKFAGRAQRAKFREIPRGRSSKFPVVATLTRKCRPKKIPSLRRALRPYLCPIGERQSWLAGWRRDVCVCVYMLLRLAAAAPALARLRPALGRALPPAIAASLCHTAVGRGAGQVRVHGKFRETFAKFRGGGAKFRKKIP